MGVMVEGSSHESESDSGTDWRLHRITVCTRPQASKDKRRGVVEVVCQPVCAQRHRMLGAKPQAERARDPCAMARDRERRVCPLKP